MSTVGPTRYLILPPVIVAWVGEFQSERVDEGKKGLNKCSRDKNASQGENRSGEEGEEPTTS